jgi:hypothetical protein
VLDNQGFLKFQAHYMALASRLMAQHPIVIKPKAQLEQQKKHPPTARSY